MEEDPQEPTRPEIIHSIRSLGAIIGHINRRENIGQSRRGDKGCRRVLMITSRRLQRQIRNYDRLHGKK